MSGVALAFFPAVCAFAQASLPQEAAQAFAVFDAELARIRGQPEDPQASLPRQYLSQLAALRRKFQENGDLDGTVAVMREAKRFVAAIEGETDPFEVVPELPESALVKAPEALRQLQDGYLKARTERAGSSEKQVAELVVRLADRLDAIVKDLTMRNRIPEALAVRKEAETWRRAVADGRVAEAVERRSPPRTAANTSDPGNDTPDPHVPASPPGAPWRSWKFDRVANYAQEGALFAHPDLPDELTLEFDKERGHMRVHGVAKVAQAPVEMRERFWFGKAVRWFVPSPESLDATFVITSKEFAAGKDLGPAAQIVIQSDKTRQQTFTVPLMYRETSIQIAYDKPSKTHRISWIQGQTGVPVELPADATNIRLLFSIAVYRPGERCDSAIVIR